MPSPSLLSPTQLVSRLYEAFGRGDVQSVLDSFAETIVWNEAENFLYADLNPYRGPRAVLNGVFTRLVSEWDGFSVNAESFVGEGNQVVACGRYRGTYKATNRELNAQFVHVWTIAEDKVTSFQQYTDTLQFARVADRL